MSIANEKTTPEVQLESKEQREDHNENNRVPLGLDLARETAHTHGILWVGHALNNQVTEEQSPKANGKLVNTSHTTKNGEQGERKEAKHQESEEVSHRADGLLCSHCMLDPR